jgi:hypothetical protein
MPQPITKLTLEQFARLLREAVLARRVTEVHLHHTWRPRHRDFRGLATIEAMRKYHRGLGWSDIAQHLTIDPLGGLWTGRNWNSPPASQKGHNGDRRAGPFMIEMIGDFDAGRDPFDGAQRDAAVAVVARLLERFELEPDAVRFHRDLGSPKSCPGTGIDRAKLLAAVKAARAKLSAPRAAPRAARSILGPSHLLGFAVTESRAEHGAVDDVQPPEDAESGRRIDEEAVVESVRRREDGGRRMLALRPRAEDRWAGLKPYVVNLAAGRLSEAGEAATSPGDLDRMLDEIEEYAREAPEPRLLLYAHGGLVGETAALEYAARLAPWWKAKGVYPVFFVWETGLLEVIGQYVLGRRDLADWTSDLALETLLRAPGTLVWSGMKRSARLASSPDAGDGQPGGAHLFVGMLARRLRDGSIRNLRLHAAGHSAGSIFHAHLLPALRAQGLGVETLQLMAPAVTVALFREKLAPLIDDGSIERLSLFTMDDRAERSDSCLSVYRKSLLYLVSRAFEGAAGRPLLGLERSLARTPALAALFGLGGAPASPRAELQLSRIDDDAEPNPLTAALRHGDFDNDPATMSAVLRRVLGVDDDSGLGRHDFPFTIRPRSLDDLPLPAAAGAPVPVPVVVPGTPCPPGAPSASSAAPRRALCVGIDRYADRPLAGCVGDARAWGAELERLGFAVDYLLDEQATRQAILDALAAMIGRASAGDVLVFQYAGHGTQLDDADGDESDRFDEAFVPYDYASGRFLIDDDLAAVLAAVPDGALVTLFMDCCHSGTNSRFAPLLGARGGGGERVRFLPPTPELQRAHLEMRAGMPAAPRGAAEASARRVLHHAACQDFEYAWETGTRGDFTAAATRLLADAVSRGLTNEAFLAAVRDDVARRGRQHPMLMAPPPELAERPLLAPLAARAGVRAGTRAGRA